MASIPTIRLADINFDIPVLQFAQYQSNRPDPSILPRSLQLQNAMRKESNDNINAIDTALNKIKFSLDESEYSWIEKRANEIRQKLDEQANAGNYQTAIRYAQQEAQNLARDKDIANKTKIHNDRTLFLGAIDKDTTLSSETKRRSESVNAYKYDGTPVWKPVWYPTKEYTVQQLIDLAYEKTANEGGGSDNKDNSRFIYVDANGNETTDTRLAVRKVAAIVNNKNYKYQRKTAENMYKTLNDLLMQKEYYQGLKQNVESQLWAYNEALNKADNADSEEERNMYLRQADDYAKVLRNKKGYIPSYSEETGISDEDFDEYIKEKVTPMFGNMEYNITYQGGANRIDIEDTQLAANLSSYQQHRYTNPIDDIEGQGYTSRVKKDYDYFPFVGADEARETSEIIEGNEARETSKNNKR